MNTHHAFDPKAPDLGFDPYDLLIHAVAPRPIAFVSTLSVDGVPNLAPFSFFMGAGSNPVSVCFSPCTKGDGSFKDTLRNIHETGEYVIHTVSGAMTQGMVATSRPVPYGVSEGTAASPPSLRSRSSHPACWRLHSPWSASCTRWCTTAADPMPRTTSSARW